MKSRALLLPATLLLCLAAVFAYHWQYLGLPFYSDDYVFTRLKEPSSPAAIGYKIRLETFEDALALFSPHRNWFWRPAQLFYFPAMVAVFGPTPLAFHAANFIIHACVIWLAAWLIYRMSRSIYAAVLTAVVFLLCPNNVQAVWWVSSGSVMFCAAWCLACAHFWLSFRRGGGALNYWIAIACLVMASMWKSEVIFLPLLIILIDAVYFRLKPSRAMLMPYVLPTAWMLVFVWLERTAAKGYTAIDPFMRKFDNEGYGGRLTVIWQNVGQLYVRTATAETYFACTVTVVALICWFRGRRDEMHRAATVFVGMALLFLTLFPLLVGSYVLQERFRYFPVLFASIALATALTADRPRWVIPVLVSGHMAVAAIAFLERLGSPAPSGVVLLVFCAVTAGLSLLLLSTQAGDSLADTTPLLVPSVAAALWQGAAAPLLLLSVVIYVVATWWRPGVGNISEVATAV